MGHHTAIHAYHGRGEDYCCKDGSSFNMALLNKIQASEYLDGAVSPRQILANKEAIGFVKTGHRTVKFKPEALDKWIKTKTIDANPLRTGGKK